MLNTISGIAILAVTQLLLLSAWLSASPQAWLNYVWAALAIFFWAQPWSRRDPYRTISAIARTWIYGLLLLILLASVVLFESLSPLLIMLEVIFLYLLDITGQRSITKSRL